MPAAQPRKGNIFLTASQSMQALRGEMDLAEQAKRQSSISDIDGKLDGKTLQQAPSAYQQRQTAARRAGLR